MYLFIISVINIIISAITAIIDLWLIISIPLGLISIILYFRTKDSVKRLIYKKRILFSIAGIGLFILYFFLMVILFVFGHEDPIMDKFILPTPVEVNFTPK